MKFKLLYLLSFLIILITFNQLQAVKIHKANNSEKIKENTEDKEKKSACPNIIKGWLKFIEITNDSNNKPIIPQSFIKNNQFYLQQTEDINTDLVFKDIYGYLNIPSEDYFYFELNQNQLKAFTSRKPRYRKIDRFLNIADLLSESSLIPVHVDFNVNQSGHSDHLSHSDDHLSHLDH